MTLHNMFDEQEYGLTTRQRNKKACFQLIRGLFELTLACLLGFIHYRLQYANELINKDEVDEFQK